MLGDKRVRVGDRVCGGLVEVRRNEGRVVVYRGREVVRDYRVDGVGGGGWVGLCVEGEVDGNAMDESDFV